MDSSGFLTCILKVYRIFGIARKISRIGLDFLHIVAANRQVADCFAVTILIKEDDLNQTVSRDSLSVYGSQFLGCIQAKGYIGKLAVFAHAVILVNFKGFHKVDFHTLTLVHKTCGSFRYGDFLTCIHKLNGVDFLIQYETERSSNLFDLVLSKIQLLGFCRTVFACGNSIHNLALRSSERSVQSINILGGGNLIDRTLQIADREDRLIQAFVACNGAEHLARFSYGNCAFLCHIGAYHFDNGNAAFFF